MQVGRRGIQLFNEGLVAIKDKDLYSHTTPEVDATLFRKYAVTRNWRRSSTRCVFGSNVAPTTEPCPTSPGFSSDLIKVDLSTGPARLAGGASHPTNPDDAASHASSIFGGDTLTSSSAARFGDGTVPGGWPEWPV